jgi:hypothetical protein
MSPLANPVLNFGSAVAQSLVVPRGKRRPSPKAKPARFIRHCFLCQREMAEMLRVNGKRYKFCGIDCKAAFDAQRAELNKQQKE